MFWKHLKIHNLVNLRGQVHLISIYKMHKRLTLVQVGDCWRYALKVNLWKKHFRTMPECMVKSSKGQSHLLGLSQ